MSNPQKTNLLPIISIEKLLSSDPLRELKLSFRLAWQYIHRGRKWTLALTIFLMAVAFVNLVFMSSLLNGIVQGAERQVRNSSSGEIYLTPDLKHKYFSDAPKIRDRLKQLPEINQVDLALSIYGELAADDYKVPTQIRVVKPSNYEQTLNLNDNVIDGKFLSNDDEEGILLGYELIAGAEERQVPKSLEGTKVGGKIQLQINGFEFTTTVRGVFKTKYIEADRTAIISQTTWNRLLDKLAEERHQTDQKIIDQAKLPSEINGQLPPAISQILNQQVEKQTNDLLAEQKKFFDLFPGKTDFNLITIRSNPKKIPQTIEAIKQLNFENVTVQSWKESAGFMTSVNDSFIGINAIMLVVGIIIAGVTIFIVIYVDVINKRRQIGIQRAIGVKPRIIVTSYVWLSIFYAICGILVGLGLFYAILVPYFLAKPLNLPITNAHLELEPTQLLLRAQIVLIVSVISGLTPAILATRTKMLEAILGRG